MPSKPFWLSALLVTLITVLLLADTERRYIHYVKSLEDVEVELFLTQTEETPEKVTLRFDAIFHNVSDLEMWVEALNTQIYINNEYGGAYSITEGQFEVPPKGKRVVPVEAVLWAQRADLFHQARSTGSLSIRLTGRARVRIDTGGTSLKAFYSVEATFPVSGSKI